MIKNLIKICWVYFFAAFVAGYMLFLNPALRLDPYVTFIFALGVVIWYQSERPSMASSPAVSYRYARS